MGATTTLPSDCGVFKLGFPGSDTTNYGWLQSHLFKANVYYFFRRVLGARDSYYGKISLNDLRAAGRQAFGDEFTLDAPADYGDPFKNQYIVYPPSCRFARASRTLYRKALPSCSLTFYRTPCSALLRLTTTFTGSWRLK